MFVRNGDVSTSMETRRASRLVVPRHTSTVFEGGPWFMIVKVFNALPADIIATPSLELFKRSLKRYLIAHTFYTVDEYLSTRITIDRL